MKVIYGLLHFVDAFIEFEVIDFEHGMGLANIKNTVEKYHGTMDYMVKGRVFILSMMMKNERGNEDGFWSNK